MCKNVMSIQKVKKKKNVMKWDIAESGKGTIEIYRKY